MDEVIARVEATIHRINSHWWNRRSRPEAPDLRALLDYIAAEPDRIAVAVGVERERCARVADDFPGALIMKGPGLRADIAAAIRSGEKQ